MDDQLVLTLTVSGAGMRSAQPQLPDLKTFSVAGRSTSQQMQIVNGRMSFNVNYQYTLVPTRAGQQTIPPATLNVNGQILKTQPITVTVSGGGTTHPRRSSQPSQPSTPAQPSGPAADMPEGHSADEEDGYVFLKATVDKMQAYVNEQVTIDIVAYKHPRLQWSGAQFSQPEVTGFVGYDLPKPERDNATVNGEIYQRFPCMRKALFPTAAGELTIGTSTLDFSTGGFFDARQYQVTSKPLKIEVLPLPEEGRPDGFGGAVGQFRLTASADSTSVQTDEPVTLKVSVSGTGNIATVGEPSLGDLTKFKQFKSNHSEQTTVQGLQLAGTKEFEFVLMPLEAGQLTLGPVVLHYFNPATKSYESARSAPIVLTVTKSASDRPVDAVTGFTREEIRLLKKDINYIRPDAKRLSVGGGYVFARPGFIALNVLPLLVLCGATLYRRRQARLSGDEAYQRKRRGRDAADRALADAERQLAKRHPPEFYRELSRGLREFLGSRLNLPPSSVSADTTPSELRSRGVDDGLVCRIEACLRQSEAGRFAPGASDAGVMNQALELVRQCLADLERAEVE